MLSHQWRPYLPGAFVLIVALVVSACDTGPETEAEGASAEGMEEAAPEPEAGRVSIPPEIEPRTETQSMPAFHEIPAGLERKQAFFSYLAPIVRAINREVTKRREALFALAEQMENGGSLDEEALAWLNRMADRYRVDAEKPEQQVAALKPRIDIIPESLALAQGALESAWGTSRFARQGNNIFGKWCFTEGCGIVPARRRADATHEVASYEDVAEAVRDYIHHLNSHPVYAPLRERRAQARQQDRLPGGTELAAGLEKYSAKGKGYVRLIRQMISANNLADDSNEDQDGDKEA